MSSHTSAGARAPSPPPVPVRRFSVAEYHQLGEVGILTEDDRVELLEGWIVPKMVHNPPHDNAIELCDEALRRCLPRGWAVRIQSVVTTPDSEPEPDLAVVRGTPRERGRRHPLPAEVGLVIEVSDSSLEIDRGTKARIYAAAGIACYWLVNLVDRQVEIFTEPSGSADEPAYGGRSVHRSGAVVELVLDGTAVARIAVDDLLP